MENVAWLVDDFDPNCNITMDWCETLYTYMFPQRKNHNDNLGHHEVKLMKLIAEGRKCWRGKMLNVVFVSLSGVKLHVAN